MWHSSQQPPGAWWSRDEGPFVELQRYVNSLFEAEPLCCAGEGDWLPSSSPQSQSLHLMPTTEWSPVLACLHHWRDGPSWLSHSLLLVSLGILPRLSQKGLILLLFQQCPAICPPGPPGPPGMPGFKVSGQLWVIS